MCTVIVHAKSILLDFQCTCTCSFLPFGNQGFFWGGGGREGAFAPPLKQFCPPLKSNRPSSYITCVFMLRFAPLVTFSEINPGNYSPLTGHILCCTSYKCIELTPCIVHCEPWTRSSEMRGSWCDWEDCCDDVNT